MGHVPIKTIERFADRTLDPAELWPVVEHLHQGCPRCLARLEIVADRLDAAHLPSDLEDVPLPETPGARLRALARALKGIPRWQREEVYRDRFRERARTGKHLERLVNFVHPVATVEVLLELSFAERYRNPGKMLDLAQKAADIAKHAERRAHGFTHVEDLRARALAELANACRVNLLFEKARDTFDKAWAAWRSGSRDQRIEARLCDLEASYASSRRVLPVAFHWLGLARELYQTLGETHLVGRNLISQGINTHYDGREAEAVVLLREGLASIDRARDPQLFSQGQVNLLHALTDNGEYQAAAKFLLESSLRQELAGDVANTARLGWIEGKILAGLGRHRRAIREMERARDTFLERQEVYDAALLGLELARVWLGLGEWAKVQALARESRDVLVRLGIPTAATTAVVILEAACEQQTATQSLFQRVLRFVRLAEWYPERAFKLAGPDPSWVH